MAKLFGRHYRREELLKRVGDLSQIAGVRLAELGDGFERGVRIAEVCTGSGFGFTVLIDRGMDIGAAAFGGAPLAWRSATTAVAPGFFEPEGLGWLRGFHGGLVTTCGLTSVGAPSEGAGLHGRASYLPATHLAYGGDWKGEDYEMWVSGQVREAAVFGENLVLRRRISARLGDSKLVIEDIVGNEGYRRTPHMMLYHVNLGFPVVGEESELVVASADVRPRDETAAAGLESYSRFEAPTAGYEEQVFYHSLEADAEGYVQAAIINRAFYGGRGLGAYLRFRQAELPCLVQWKMMGEGEYVCGLEPATNRVEGRAKERGEGRLIELEPGETRHYCLEIGVLDGLAEIDAFMGQLP